MDKLINVLLIVMFILLMLFIIAATLAMLTAANIM